MSKPISSNSYLHFPPPHISRLITMNNNSEKKMFMLSQANLNKFVL